MDPGSHGQFGDEDIAPFREEDWCLGRDHLHFWVCLHDLLDTRKRELVQFVIVRVLLQVVDNLLPVGSQDVFVLAVKSLVNLLKKLNMLVTWKSDGFRLHTFAHDPE